MHSFVMASLQETNVVSNCTFFFFLVVILENCSTLFFLAFQVFEEYLSTHSQYILSSTLTLFFSSVCWPSTSLSSMVVKHSSSHGLQQGCGGAVGHMWVLHACCLLPPNKGKPRIVLLAKAKGCHVISWVGGRWQQSPALVQNSSLGG